MAFNVDRQSGCPRLVSTVTADGLRLDGAFCEPPVSARLTLLLIHGTGSNFYSPGPLEALAQSAAFIDCAALRVNTRGHDGMATIPGSPRSVQGGATFEAVTDSSLDIAAWIDHVSCLNEAATSASGIVLVGHSMGGVKAIYSQARSADPRVKGVVCLSPPRFCHEHWMQHSDAEEFRRSFAEATRLVDEGRPNELLVCRQPVPFVATARGFIEKYGPDDTFDIVRLLPRVDCPVLILIGSRTVDASPAFDSLPEQLNGLAELTPVSLEVIADADMSYSQCPDRVLASITEWLGDIDRESGFGV